MNSKTSSWFPPRSFFMASGVTNIVPFIILNYVMKDALRLEFAIGCYACLVLDLILVLGASPKDTLKQLVCFTITSYIKCGSVLLLLRNHEAAEAGILFSQLFIFEVFLLFLRVSVVISLISRLWSEVTAQYRDRLADKFDMKREQVDTILSITEGVFPVPAFNRLLDSCYQPHDREAWRRRVDDAIKKLKPDEPKIKSNID